VSRRVLLVRHGAPHPRWSGICYGRTDVGLGPQGRAQGRQAVGRLAEEPIHRLYTSHLRRARWLADRIAGCQRIEPIVEPALAERNFGDWEARSWDEIHAESGPAMEGLIRDPKGFRPGGGETTAELAARALAWYHHLPSEGLVVAVTHGGPIAALRGSLLGLPVPAWLGLVPPFGAVVEVSPR
jgi:broad specificity phosphatase PhoE